MSFPLSIEGEIRLDSQHDLAIEPFLADVRDGLEKARATSIERVGSRLEFTVGLLRFVSNWNLLVSVERGEIEVVQGQPLLVRFDFSCRRLLLFATLGVAWLASMPLLDGEVGFAAVIAVVGWMWLFGLNYAIAALRLTTFVRKHVTAHRPDLQRPA